MVARLSAFVIWALVAATAVFWGLRLFVRAPAAPAYAVPVGDAAAAHGDLSRLLGSAPVVASAAPVVESNSRFRLLGIMAPKTSSGGGHGVALIAVDGKLPRAYTVGTSVDSGLVLQSVSLRTVSIGPGAGAAPSITLELPPPTAAATGKLPAGGTGGAYVPPPIAPGFTPPPAVSSNPPATVAAQPAVVQPATAPAAAGPAPQGVPVPPRE